MIKFLIAIGIFWLALFVTAQTFAAEVAVEEQTNTTTVTNKITINANTGNNTANFTNNGDVQITTGDVHVSASVTHLTNSNRAEPAIQVMPNESEVRDEVEQKEKSEVVSLAQNKTSLVNKITVQAETGGNEASYTTNGNVFIKTGDSSLTQKINNKVNTNKGNILASFFPLATQIGYKGKQPLALTFLVKTPKLSI